MKKDKLIYRGRKKYTKEEAEKQMENTMQMISTNKELLYYWKNSIETKSDKLIQALTNETKEEMIEKAEKQSEYLISKYNYIKQFSPDYKLKGSFGYF